MLIVYGQDMMNVVSFHAVAYPSWSEVCFSLLDLSIGTSDTLMESYRVKTSGAVNTTLEQTAGTDSGIFLLARCYKITCDKTWTW